LAGHVAVTEDVKSEGMSVQHNNCGPSLNTDVRLGNNLRQNTECFDMHCRISPYIRKELKQIGFSHISLLAEPF